MSYKANLTLKKKCYQILYQILIIHEVLHEVLHEVFAKTKIPVDKLVSKVV